MAELDRADEVLAKTGMSPVEARLSRVVGCNVQSVVETKHHLIVAHEVTNQGYDRDALAMMAHAAKDVMASDAIEAIADKGYYSGEEIVAAEKAGIAVTVSKPHTSNAAAVGRFDKADFVYIPDDDSYVCPAGERLTYHMTSELDGKIMRSYWTNVCGPCPVKRRCTTGKERRLRRWEHEAILEGVQKRLDDDPSKVSLCSKTVEHPFGTIKAWMGATHFKMKTMKHVGTEMALHVLAYNMMRVIAILGVSGLVKAMRA